MPQDFSTQMQTYALKIVRKLRQAGHQAYWVGGAVRDKLMGKEPVDIDIATSALPDEVQKLFPHHVAVGKVFGVIQVMMDHESFEVATFREDVSYVDGRHPTDVRFADAKADAQRRDFTINGLFYDPEHDTVLDFVDGQRDIEAKIIRAIGDPEQRFSEDYLRMLRAVRFASVLEFTLDPATAAAIKKLAQHITAVSPERIQMELTRLLTESRKAGQGLLLLKDMGLLEVILPEVSRMTGQAQPPQFHPEGDVLTHTALMLDLMEKPSVTLAYAVLLHDVGKPPTATLSIEPDGSERIRFDRHAQVGAEMALDILKRLRLPNDEIDRICQCIERHMHFMNVPQMRKATLRKLVGAPTFPEELELHRLDCLGSHGYLDNYDFLKNFMEELKNEPVLPDPWINGRDLLQMGIPEGPEIGRLLKKAYELQLDGSVNSREELLDWVRKERQNS
jgi:poly(A) polymerase